jgi:hypothetical protein
MIRLKKSGGGIALALLMFVALGLRLYGLSWDEGHLFHPDERWILLVVDELALPPDLVTFLNPESPLNPHFFAYGSFPLYLLKGAAHLLSYWREDFSQFDHLHPLLDGLSDVSRTWWGGGTWPSRPWWPWPLSSGSSPGFRGWGD